MFVKKLKVGELAEGENPWAVAEIADESVEGFLNPVPNEDGTCDEKWEMATQEEFDNRDLPVGQAIDPEHKAEVGEANIVEAPIEAVEPEEAV